MSDRLSHRLMIAALIAVLYVPLIHQAYSLHAGLTPGQGIADLRLLSLASLLLLFLLPYTALAWLGIEWNPQRARLGEYDA